MSKRCECGLWTGPDGLGTGCTETTKRRFAPGHDARLASWLTQHQAAGRQVRRGDDAPVAPAEAATTIGLRYDIAERAARLANRKPRKTRKAATRKPTEPITATIKLGRWSYDNATIAPSGEASYRTKSGQEKTAPAGSYKVLLTVGGDDQ